MDWLRNHFGSMGYVGDFYFPESGGGKVGIGKRLAGHEQIRTPNNNNQPVKKRNTESCFTRIQRFFTWEQFLSYIDWRGGNWWRSSQKTSGKSYQRTKTCSFKEALDLAKYGWPEGLRGVKDAENKIIFTPHEQLGLHYEQTTEHDVAGGSVNIGRYLMGMPDCMRHVKSPKPHVFPSRIQKIFVVDATNRDTQTDEIINHGHMVYQIIEALELANIRTELTLVHSANKQYMESKDDYYFFETYIKLKSPEDVIYPEKLIFTLAHPSMFRRLVISSWEREPLFVRSTFGFYDEGHYGTYIRQWMPPKSLTKDALIIPGYDKPKQMQEVLRQVKSMIESQYDAVRQ